MFRNNCKLNGYQFQALNEYAIQHNNVARIPQQMIAVNVGLVDVFVP